MNRLLVRTALPSDLPALLPVYDTARAFMAAHGNPDQWRDGYPKPEKLAADIAKNQQYVVLDDGRICGAFALVPGPESIYDHLAGRWHAVGPYGVLHRLASDGTRRGVFHAVLGFSAPLFRLIRADTHAANGPMQRLLVDHGFRLCGEITGEDGTPRLAYDHLSHRAVFTVRRIDEAPYGCEETQNPDEVELTITDPVGNEYTLPLTESVLRSQGLSVGDPIHFDPVHGLLRHTEE